MTYYDEMYPDKPYTYNDVELSESGGACPFQAIGQVGQSDFYFRVRHGAASLSLTNHGEEYTRSVNVNTAEYGYLDGTCDQETFERLFNMMVSDYREKHIPKYDAEDGQYDFTDVKVLSISYDGELVFEGDFLDIGADVRMNIEGGTATLVMSNGYHREMNVFTAEYDYLNGIMSDSGELVRNMDLLIRVFNALMADYID